ncbi:phosphatase PAP2 family protein [Cellulomonas sp. KRMCY2]|uniref:phosphatase PAP2 family protein n=1 Tax=Cellulomonas sp. KRMCY2 TaxID=1304865 RepID=UPI00045EC70A|nr:phosphatase PAP2 family protein [Cellulomonas sp. KRMCY2]
MVRALTPQTARTRDDALSGDDAAAPGHVGSTRPRLWPELAFLGIVYLLYSVVRNAAPSRVARAVQNAHDILDLERLLGLDVEHSLNTMTTAIPAIAVPANVYYGTLHFAVTGAVLVWVYVSRPHAYRKARGVLLVMTLLALVGYWLYPLAPPRLTPGEGYVDTMRTLGIWGVAPSDLVVSASNQYAAMPSMHIGWSLWSGLVLVRHTARPVLRVLGALYPAVTLLVVVVTGNHYVLDAVGAVIVLVVAVGIVAATADLVTVDRPAG